MSEPAKLPPRFFTKPEVHIEDLKIGESAWVTFTEMKIDSEGCAYIDPQATVRGPGRNRIEVTRTEQGFEVFIAHSDLYWKKGEYRPTEFEKYARYVPVVKITYEQRTK
jgi:hypothetical protein